MNEALKNPDLSLLRGPDKSASRIERPKGGPQGERSESSREINKLDPGAGRGDALFRGLLASDGGERGITRAAPSPFGPPPLRGDVFHGLRPLRRTEGFSPKPPHP